MENVIKITEKLAYSLMDDLCCLGIEAMGYKDGIKGYDEEGYPVFTDEYISHAADFAEEMFRFICKQVEETKGKKLVIITENEEEG